MRSNYPVSSIEMLVELRDIQETLISLIGYDSNPFDGSIDVSGSLDVIESRIDASGYQMIQSRLYDPDPSYRSYYNNELVLYYNRRVTHG